MQILQSDCFQKGAYFSHPTSHEKSCIKSQFDQTYELGSLQISYISLLPYINKNASVKFFFSVLPYLLEIADIIENFVVSSALSCLLVKNI